MGLEGLQPDRCLGYPRLQGGKKKRPRDAEACSLQGGTAVTPNQLKEEEAVWSEKGVGV